MAARPKAKSGTSKQATREVPRLLATNDAGFARTFAELIDRRDAGRDDVVSAAEKIALRVRDGGDAELLACVRKYDGAKLDAVEVTAEEWDRGVAKLDPADRAALGRAAMRVREFHRKRIPSSWEIKEEGGAFMGVRVRPLARVGLYAPGGKASYPSSVIMNAVPASVVEVPEICLASPPRPDGTLPPAILMAARLAGVHRVFKMGGAHAVAAFAYGTETVPRVDKITGPGNVWVAAAKRFVFGQVGIDAEAGPTEVVVVADKSAQAAWVASDLISQAEHDEDAQSILITPLRALATKVIEQIGKQLATLPRGAIARASLAKRGAVIVTKNLDEAIDLANRYAPEHLLLAVEDADALLKKVTNAGAVFLGHYTPVAVGDYLAGPNHVLPTGGTARFFSPLGVEDFLKRMSFTRFEPPKLRELGLEVMRLAQLEGLSGHGVSIELRLARIRRARREREAAREAGEESED
ncbi:MAG: histidinol dehydrogenase [Myxococcota bacterium]|jgi:histidinol dehydrogenase|nr:histidinol dehydrogenase [Myxococcota bacterium]